MPFELKDVRALAQLAREAGQIILHYREQHREGRTLGLEALNLEIKHDGSPVTLADIASQEHILEGIEQLGLYQPVVAEEATAPDVSTLDGFYLIDPLDGTKAFVDGGDDFTVNIGFIHHGRPVMGVLHSPVLNETYYTDGTCAYYLSPSGEESVIEARRADPEGVDVITNRTEDWSGHLKNYLAQHKVRSTERLSSAFKLGLVAHGKFDLYPRFGPTSEWDIAAGDAILRAAGGSVKTLDGNDLAYGKPRFLNPAFIARGLTSSSPLEGEVATT
ncbi:MAG: 3'(2'),5'-bisphosphate nucleotidase CysQ [Alphaproteobacteria bacterium]|nr:3'(2'),5'-bisphosphate nucleotidase CysQ [Alphaproteobacteria bacterium]